MHWSVQDFSIIINGNDQMIQHIVKNLNLGWISAFASIAQILNILWLHVPDGICSQVLRSTSVDS